MYERVSETAQNKYTLLYFYKYTIEPVINNGHKCNRHVHCFHTVVKKELPWTGLLLGNMQL